LNLQLCSMTGEERKALSFVALLLGLSVVARAVNRPDPVIVTGAAAVDIGARLQQNQQVRERLSKTSKPTSPTPKPSSAPRWRQGQRPADVLEYRRESDPPTPVQINVNRASFEELDKLPGVSPTVARRIIEYRTERGAFSSLEQLDSVKGVGPALLGKLKPIVRFR
jgi:competence ComEA-like helix-hairpin-helix protein